MIHYVNTHNENIQIGYEKGQFKFFLTKSTEGLKIPSLGFDVAEDAELAVAVAKALKTHGKDITNLGRDIKFVFRVLGIENEWVK